MFLCFQWNQVTHSHNSPFSLSLHLTHITLLSLSLSISPLSPPLSSPHSVLVKTSLCFPSLNSIFLLSIYLSPSLFSSLSPLSLPWPTRHSTLSFYYLSNYFPLSLSPLSLLSSLNYLLFKTFVCFPWHKVTQLYLSIYYLSFFISLSLPLPPFLSLSSFPLPSLNYLLFKTFLCFPWPPSLSTPPRRERVGVIRPEMKEEARSKNPGPFSGDILGEDIWKTRHFI